MIHYIQLSAGEKTCGSKEGKGPNLMMDTPVVAGTRLTVESSLKKLATGRTTKEILGALPRVPRETIEAALTFATEALRAEVTNPASPAHAVDLRSCGRRSPDRGSALAQDLGPPEIWFRRLDLCSDHV